MIVLAGMLAGLTMPARTVRAAPLYCTDHGARTLHVALYPFLPDAGDAAWRIGQAFEAGCPGLRLTITMNPDYYGPHGVLEESADVYEVDSIFARDIAARHKVLPIPDALARRVGRTVPFAEAASRPDGVQIGVPHWLCANFLFVRKGLGTPPATLDALVGWFRAKPPRDRLLLDLAGEENLGEMDISALTGAWGSAGAAMAHVGDTAAQAQAADALRNLLRAEVPGMGRDARFDLATGLYARLMARREGGAYVGYSESLHALLDETTNGCRPGACVGSDDIVVAAMPFGARSAPPVGWADMFMIDAGANARTARDAAAFIAFMMRPETYRMLLVPAPGAPPRYLLPARLSMFDDPALLAAAPHYREMAPIIARADGPGAPGLEATLQHAARMIDHALPR